MTKTGICLVLIFSVLFSLGLSIEGVASSDQGSISITVIFDDQDVTEKAQVVLMTGIMPVMMSPGQEKIAEMDAGTIEVMATLPEAEVPHMPGTVKVELKAGEEKEVEIVLQPMPGVGGPGMPDMPGGMKEDKFDPAEASDEELKNIIEDETEEEELREEAFAELDQRHGIPFLVEMLKKPEDEIQIWSLQHLHQKSLREKGESEVEREGAIPDIIPFLEVPNPEARILAASIIGNCWNFPESALTPLIRGLDAPEPEVRASFVSALGTGRFKAAEAAQPLAVLLKEDNCNTVRREAVEALGRIGKSSREVLAALQHVLNNEETELRLAAVKTLGSLKEFDNERAVIVAGALQDDDLDVRRSGARVLSRMENGLEEVVSGLIAALNDSDSTVRTRVLISFRNLDADILAENLDPLAVVLLEDDEPRVRETAARTIMEAGSATASILPALNTALSDPDGVVVAAVSLILLELGPEQVAPAIPRLIELLEIEERSNANMIALIINEIGEPAVQPLIALLDSDKVEGRRRSVNVLGWIGSPAEAAVPKLKALYQDENEDNVVRNEAYRAITNITGERPEL